MRLPIIFLIFKIILGFLWIFLEPVVCVLTKKMMKMSKIVLSMLGIMGKDPNVFQSNFIPQKCCVSRVLIKLQDLGASPNNITRQKRQTR